MNKEVFNYDHIIEDTKSTTQEEAFKFIAKIAYEKGFVSSEEAYFEGLKNRELEVTTGFKDGIAIPHSKTDAALKPGMFMIRFKNEIEWNSLDGKPVKTALALTIPMDGAKEHLKLLSLIARKLMDNEFRETLNTSNDYSELGDLINSINF